MYGCLHEGPPPYGCSQVEVLPIRMVDGLHPLRMDPLVLIQAHYIYQCNHSDTRHLISLYSLRLFLLIQDIRLYIAQWRHNQTQPKLSYKSCNDTSSNLLPWYARSKGIVSCASRRAISGKCNRTPSKKMSKIHEPPALKLGGWGVGPPTQEMRFFSY